MMKPTSGPRLPAAGCDETAPLLAKYTDFEQTNVARIVDERPAPSRTRTAAATLGAGLVLVLLLAGSRAVAKPPPPPPLPVFAALRAPETAPAVLSQAAKAGAGDAMRGDGDEYGYTVVVDAGSTGSRARAFRWPKGLLCPSRLQRRLITEVQPPVPPSPSSLPQHQHQHRHCHTRNTYARLPTHAFPRLVL